MMCLFSSIKQKNKNRTTRITIIKKKHINNIICRYILSIFFENTIPQFHTYVTI